MGLTAGPPHAVAHLVGLADAPLPGGERAQVVLAEDLEKVHDSPLLIEHLRHVEGLPYVGDGAIRHMCRTQASGVREVRREGNERKNQRSF